MAGRTKSSAWARTASQVAKVTMQMSPRPSDDRANRNLARVPGTPAPARGDGGLTLVGILDVVAILGLVATAISVAWRRTGQSRHLAETVARVHDLLDTARLEALRSGRDLAVEVDVAGRRLSIPAIDKIL